MSFLKTIKGTLKSVQGDISEGYADQYLKIIISHEDSPKTNCNEIFSPYKSLKQAT